MFRTPSCGDSAIKISEKIAELLLDFNALHNKKKNLEKIRKRAKSGFQVFK